MNLRSRIPFIARAAALGVVLLLAGCVTTEVPERPLPPPPRPVAPPDTTVFAVPLKGQSADQLDRDKYECAQWGTQQTGFDPSRPLPPPPPPSVHAVPVAPVPGSGTMTGAATGAIVGAAVANPWNPGPSTVIGLLAGAALGTAVEQSQASHAQAAAAQANSAAAAGAQASRDANVEAQASSYRRAVSACLDARGYSVR